MLRVSLKGVWAHKVRLLLTGLAIILGVGLISGVYVYTDTIGKAFDGIFTDVYAGIDIVVGTESDFSLGEGTYLDESEFELIQGVDGVEEVFPYLAGLGVTILDPEGEMLASGPGPPTFVSSISVPPDASSSDNPGEFTIVEGAYPAGEGQVALDRGTAELGGFEIGDPVTVISDLEGRMELILAGVAVFGEQDSLGGTKWVFFDLPTTQAFLQRPGKLSGGSVQVTPGTPVDDVIARIEALLPDHATVVSGQDAAEEEAADIQAALSFFTIFLSVFGWVALFVGSFLIYNTFRIVVSQRTKELALLRALGAAGRQVRGIVLLEAAIIGAIGAVLGIGFGVMIAFGLQQILPAVGIELPTASLDIKPRTILVGLAAGLGITLVAALVPARRASKVSVMAALREDAAGPQQAGILRRTLLGTAISGVGLAALFFGLYGDTGSGPSPVVYVGVGTAVIFLGIFVLSPLAARPVTNLIGMLLERLTGTSGKLARRNAMRSPRRTAATAAAVMISITLVALASTLTGSIRGTIDDVLANDVDAEVIISPAGQFGDPTQGFTSEVAERVKQLDRVEDLTRIHAGWGRLVSETEISDGETQVDVLETFITGAEPNLADFLPPDSFQGTLRPGPGELIISTADGFALGDTVVIEFEQTGRRSFTLVGIVGGRAWAGIIAIPAADWISAYGIDQHSQVYVKAADGVGADELKAAIEPVLTDYPNIAVQTFEDLQSEAEAQLNGLLNFILALLALAVVIGMLGVTNTMALSVFERTREIGLLRAVGLDRRATRWMVRSEASIVSVFGALMGIGLGIFFGWALIRALADLGFSSFVIPWLPSSATAAGILGSLVFWLVATGVLGIVFAVFPARRAAKLNVIEAIAHF
ncbi:MAG: FtsX-like permease family protein [bacterium]|nr:FtsX-like permease family protein [bacterium]MDE0287340.1 FtsX-like permease family protein [bacterium]MDE0439159.1 FtsX-like permease family protein [bacterium]